MSESGSNLHTETVAITADGTELDCYLAYDEGGAAPHPGVLVVHEWWGLNDYIRKRANMLAELGYTALAVDMYGGGQVAGAGVGHGAAEEAQAGEGGAARREAAGAIVGHAAAAGEGEAGQRGAAGRQPPRAEVGGAAAREVEGGEGRAPRGQDLQAGVRHRDAVPEVQGDQPGAGQRQAANARVRDPRAAAEANRGQPGAGLGEGPQHGVANPPVDDAGQAAQVDGARRGEPCCEHAQDVGLVAEPRSQTAKDDVGRKLVARSLPLLAHQRESEQARHCFGSIQNFENVQDHIQRKVDPETIFKQDHMFFKIQNYYLCLLRRDAKSFFANAFQLATRILSQLHHG